MQKILFLTFIILLSTSVFADLSANPVDGNPTTPTCYTESVKCDSCTFASSENAETGTLPIILVIALLSGYAYLQYKKPLYPIIGSVLIISIITSSLLLGNPTETDECILSQDSSAENVDQVAEDVFVDARELNEFQKDESDFPSSNLDEFQPTDDEFSDDNLDEFNTSLNEFSENRTTDSEAEKLSQKRKKHISELLIILIALIIIRIFKHLPRFRKLRPLFLLGFLIWLGFVRGGCPCMISSFQNLILGVFGADVDWVSLLWFVGLIPATYLLGKLWCGWLCHLGALQEFLFSSNQIEALKTPKAQKILHWIQVSVFLTLILQIAITRSNIFIHYDPFKVAFNLFSAHTTGYVLLVILLASSLFVYRPFCRLFCPVGLVLSWVTLLPGARKITQTEDCIDCISCSKACNSHSIHYANKTSTIDIKSCIACGECIDSCNKDALNFKRKTIDNH